MLTSPVYKETTTMPIKLADCETISRITARETSWAIRTTSYCRGHYELLHAITPLFHVKHILKIVDNLLTYTQVLLAQIG